MPKHRDRNMSWKKNALPASTDLRVKQGEVRADTCTREMTVIEVGK